MAIIRASFQNSCEVTLGTRKVQAPPFLFRGSSLQLTISSGPHGRLIQPYQIGFTFFLNRCSESRSGRVANGVLLYTCQKL